MLNFLGYFGLPDVAHFMSFESYGALVDKIKIPGLIFKKTFAILRVRVCLEWECSRSCAEAPAAIGAPSSSPANSRPPPLPPMSWRGSSSRSLSPPTPPAEFRPLSLSSPPLPPSSRSLSHPLFFEYLSLIEV